MRYIENPPNPYSKYSSEFLGEPSSVKLEVYEETATKKMITKAWSADFGNRFTVNCYRGCITPAPIVLRGSITNIWVTVRERILKQKSSPK